MSITPKADIDHRPTDVEPYRQYPIIYFSLLLIKKLSGRLVKCPLTWKCVRNSGLSLNSSIQKKELHIVTPLTERSRKPNEDVSALRWWVLRFSIGGREVCVKTCFGRPCIVVNTGKFGVDYVKNSIGEVLLYSMEILPISVGLSYKSRLSEIPSYFTCLQAWLTELLLRNNSSFLLMLIRESLLITVVSH